MNRPDQHNNLALPMQALLEIEEAFNEPRFFGLAVGPTLNDVLVVALSDARHVWGWRQRAGVRLRSMRQRYRQPFSSGRELGDVAGRMIFTWLFNRGDLKSFVVPLLGNYRSNECVVLGPERAMAQQLTGQPTFLTWDDFPAIDMGCWRREFARCEPLWRARLDAVLRRHGIPAYVGTFLLTHLQTQTQFVMASDAFLERVRPPVIVTEYDRNAHASCLLLAAAARGIPSVTMVHAAAMPYPSFGMAPLVATQVCCWGEVHREKFRRYGVADAHIVVTGCQATAQALDADGTAVRARIGVAPQQPLVMLATSPVKLEVRKHYATVFCAAMVALPGVAAIVRLHPAERLAEYQDVIAAFPAVRFLANSAMTRDESLSCADLVVSHESSFGIDAVLKGKIVIVLELMQQDGALKIVRELIDNAGCPRAGDSAELALVVGKALADDAWRDGLHAAVQLYAGRHCVSYGQEAAARVCQVIDALAARKPQPRSEGAAS